ncbi:MAG: hypothetical protein IJZ36_05505 [Bacilli bacterium]|nr:hypothetical protein [Bacilli bacterium]
MKRVNNIYNSIVDIKAIQTMYNKKIKLNTKNKIKLERFENNYVSNMIYIKNTLENKSYIPGKYNIFLIKEPKLRLIMSQNVFDKIINHMVSKYFLVDIYSNTLINENIATRENKGTHYGINLLKKYLNEVKKDEFYILKFDISKYFYNLDHDILKNLVRRKIKDKDVLKIIDDIIDSTDSEYVNKEINRVKQKEINKVLNSNVDNKNKILNNINKIPVYKKGKGLPIGNMSSQILAVLYLNELDHFIKEKLNIKYYIRYMDDGVIIHKDKKYLEYCLVEIEKIIDKYKLELNNKTRIYKCNEGFDFLGFKFILKNNKVIMKVKNDTKKRFKRKMKNLYTLLNNNKICYRDLMQVKNSYLGHLGHGNTSKLVTNTMDMYINKNEFVVTNITSLDNL